MQYLCRDVWPDTDVTGNLPWMIPGFQIIPLIYITVSFSLLLSVVVSQFFRTLEHVRDFDAIRLIFFSLVLGILMLVDSRLTYENRRSLVWYGIMTTGLVISLLIGVNLAIRYCS